MSRIRDDHTIQDGVVRFCVSGKHGIYALVDEEDWPLVNARSWHARRDHQTHYAVSTYPDHWFLHRFVLDYTGSLCVDHLNHDGLDCRKRNLNIVSKATNNISRRAHARKCTSRFKGVSWSAAKNRWVVFVKEGGRRKWLGAYRDEVQAAQVYDEAARRVYRNNAVLNFPRPGERTAS